ncbi:4334_t:CDS:2, partial [Cetraspora pellucida]
MLKVIRELVFASEYADADDVNYQNMKYSKWLESAIHQRHIKSYCYNDFSIFEEIGDGGFGTVHRSKWKTNGLIIALKKLKEDHSDEKSNERFIKE